MWVLELKPGSNLDSSVCHVTWGKLLNSPGFCGETSAWHTHSQWSTGDDNDKDEELLFWHVCHCLRRQYFPEMGGWLHRLEQYVHLTFELSGFVNSVYLCWIIIWWKMSTHTHIVINLRYIQSDLCNKNRYLDAV